MVRRACVLVVWLIASVPVLAAAQPLEDFLVAARRNAFGVRAAQAVRSQAEAVRVGSNAALLPRVDATAKYTHNEFEAKFVDPGPPPRVLTIVPGNQWSLLLNFEMPLVDLNLWALRGVAGTRLEAARAQEQSSILDAEREVVEAYFQLAGARAVADASRRAVAASEELVRVARARLTAGTASELDEARAVSELESRRRTLAESVRASVEASRRLETASGLAHPDPESPKVSLEHEVPLERWLPLVDALPGVSAARLNAKARRDEAQATSFRLLPTLSARGLQTLGNAAGFNGNSAYYDAGVILRFPLDATPIAESSRVRAVADEEDVRSEETRRKAEDRLVIDWAKVEELVRNVQSARAEAESTALAARLALARYTAGGATSLDVVQGRRDAFVAEATLLSAEAQLASARASLRISAGLSTDAAGPGATP